MTATRWQLPFEALSALAIVGAMGFAAKIGVAEYQKFENWGKPKRFNVDKWDRQMMERDSRLTGNVNFQRCEPTAPASFKTNSATVMERPLI